MTRERQILDAAATLFYERGFHNVGIDEIGERVGITGPAIYGHFSSKHHLLGALFHEALDQLFLATGARQDDPHEELAALIHEHAAYALAHRELVGLYSREHLSLADPWRQEVARRANKHMRHWCDVLLRCCPGRSADEIASASHAAVGLLNSTAHWPRAALRTPDVAALLERLVADTLSSLTR